MRREHQSTYSLRCCGKRALKFSALAAWVLLLCCAGLPAQAGFVSGSFKIDIGESARTLDAMLKEERGEFTTQQFLNVKMEEMWKATGIRLIDRNRPAIVLQNTSDPSSGNEINQFTIDIKQLGYQFGNGDFNPDPFGGALTYLSKYSDAGVTLSSNYGTVSDVDLTLDPTKIVLNISGLTPGKAAIFRVDLDPVPLTTPAFPDFRHVLLGADIEDGNGPATPATISAMFTMGEGENQMSTATQPINFAPGMGETFPTAGFLEPYRNQSASNLYTQTGATEIPEPASVLLLLAGMAGWRCRRRR